MLNARRYAMPLLIVSTWFLLAATGLGQVVDAAGEAAGPTFRAEFERFLGRLHPMTVHFPVALIIAAALFELIGGRRTRQPSPSGRACIALGAVSAVAAAFLGWLNAAHEPHSRTLARAVEVHRWSAIATTALALIALLLSAMAASNRSPRLRVAYRYALFAAALGVSFAGHVGGTLVYGKDYALKAFEAMRRATRNPAPSPTTTTPTTTTTTAPDAGGPVDPSGDSSSVATDRVDFRTQIAPIFAAHCYECHGPDEQEGQLGLHDRDMVFGGDPTMWTIMPGDPDDSILIELIELDPDDPDFMPADHDPLSPAQIELLRRWIDEGAEWPVAGTATASTATSHQPAPATNPPAPPSETRAADREAPPAPEIESLSDDQRAAIEQAIVYLTKNNAAVARGPGDAVQVDFAPAGSDIGDPHMELLLALDPVLTAVDMTGTAISDVGLIQLEEMPVLRSVRLSGTTIGDDGLKHLFRCEALRDVYVDGTRVTDAGVRALSEALPYATIHR